MYEDKEYQAYLKRLRTYCAEVVADPIKSATLLFDAGITKKNGKLTERYKDLDRILVQVAK